MANMLNRTPLCSPLTRIQLEERYIEAVYGLKLQIGIVIWTLGFTHSWSKLAEEELRKTLEWRPFPHISLQTKEAINEEVSANILREAKR